MAETKRLTIPAAEELLGLYFPILDHGFMSLVDYMGGDAAIERAARTSYQYGTRKKSDQRQLLRHLKRNRHTSPFEFTELVFHCCMPIVCARQWIRHRTASVSELSGRYSLMPMLFYTPSNEQVKKQSKRNKQGRDGELDIRDVIHWKECLEYTRACTKSTYLEMTENDLARELARIDLPLSTYSQWFWKIDAHNFFHALGLRCGLHAQWEIRQYFNWMAGAGKRLMPIAFEAWEDYEFYGARMSRMEMELLRQCLMDDNGRLCPTADHISVTDMKDKGMGKTERAEFVAKFRVPEKMNFDLDLSAAKPAEFFEEKMRKAAEG